MARPKDADSAATYDRIIGAALELLTEYNDPSAISMREVADRADVSKSAIHYYFGHKDDLLEACLDGYYERLTGLAARLIHGTKSTSSRELIEGYMREFYRFVCQEGPLVSLRLSLNSRRGGLHPRRQSRFLGSEIAHAAKLLSPHVEVSEIDTSLSIQAVASMLVQFSRMSDEELEHLTGEKGAKAREAVGEYVVRAARRLIRPSDG